MCRNRPSSPYQQQGSMLVISIFIIVVISLLAASLSRILSSTADSVANEVYSAKAYFAADSGMEYGIYQVLQQAASGTCPSLSLILNETGLENCTVEISCESIPIDAANNEYQYYLESKGTCDGGKIVAQHKVEAEVKL